MVFFFIFFSFLGGFPSWVGEHVVFFSHAVWCGRVRSVGDVIFVKGGLLYCTVIVERRRDIRIFKERIWDGPGSLLLVGFLSNKLYF